MINLRFHIVSIVAVFLALAIGILTGSTLLDRATIEVLQDRQESLDRRNAELHEELDGYKAHAETTDRVLGEFADDALEDLVPGLLTDDPLLVIASKGVDAESVRELESLLSDAGATTVGTVWVDKRVDLRDTQRREHLAELLGIDLADAEPDEAADDPDEARVDAEVALVAQTIAEALSAEIPDPDAGSSSGTVPARGEPQQGLPGQSGQPGADQAGAGQPGSDQPGSDQPGSDQPGSDQTGAGQRANPADEGSASGTSELRDPVVEREPTAHDVVTLLAGDGLVDWRDDKGEPSDLDEFAAGTLRIVVVTGEGAELDDESFVRPLVEALAERRGGTVLAEIHRPRTTSEQVVDGVDGRRGERVAFARTDDRLRDRVVTVDHADEPWGRLAVVMALSGVDPADGGAWGFGPTADRVLPPLDR